MGRLILNDKIKLRANDTTTKIFCQEDYAQEAYEKYSDYFAGKTVTTKDLQEGQICSAEVVRIEANGKVLVQSKESSQTIYVDLQKESKFIEKHTDKQIQRGMRLDVFIESAKNDSYIGSVEKAFKSRLKKELNESMKNKLAAYEVTIKSINDGGFIVDLSGMDCFMPGSLAAANKIINFESMIGKKVMVMVENYLEASDMYVVSNKRYIQSILPQKVKELKFDEEYTGKVTGTMAYGAFVEWNEMFTGLLHESEVEGDTWKNLKAGHEVSFWIKEIKEGKDIRIILTQKGPSTENKIYQELKDEYEGQIHANASIKDVRPFGVFIELKGGLIGMMPPKEFKKTNCKMKEGEILDVYVKQVDVSQKRVHLKAVEDEDN